LKIIIKIMTKILVTGGTGYIGSHTVVELQAAGYECLIVDNLSNSKLETLDLIEKISGQRPLFVRLDLRHKKELADFLEENQDIVAVIHFAGAKSVGESVTNPLKYYENNVGASVNLLQALQAAGVKNLIFSSTAAVYGEAEKIPVDETTPIQKPSSPYGNTKKMIEEIIYDVCVADEDFQAIALRYFNVAGAHESALIGELPSGIPANLVPFITQSAIGKLPPIKVFGNDYPTTDGYGVRDYIHVVDLARAHVAALRRLLEKENEMNWEFYNLGTGRGNSVKEVIDAFEKVNDVKLAYEIAERRPGDIAEIFTKTDLANEKLQWQAERNLEDILKSAWKWEKTLR